MSQFETPTITAKCWDAASIDAAASWRCRISEACCAQLLEAAKPSVDDISGFTPAANMLSQLQEELQPAVRALENGRGFAVISCLPEDVYKDAELKALYWMIGHALGEPVVQNLAGTLLFDVKDTGTKMEPGARVSLTNAESMFHTDNSFGEQVLDYVGLLCLRAARSGGLSQNISGYTVLQRLKPAEAETLQKPFYMDKRAGAKEGESSTAYFPVFDEKDSELVVRYVRYGVEEGHRKAGVPLTSEQTAALDALDRQLADSDLRVEFILQRGEMLLANNRWLLHNRTAFDDFDEPERRRHLVRLWINRQAAGLGSPKYLAGKAR
jgi:alpha-ketoglutarate-dependent taurine dioxygenase